MVFINESSLLMTRFHDHCLETIHFPSLEVLTYAGLCRVYGAIYDVKRLEMRMKRPLGLAYNERDTIYVGVYTQHYMLAINTANDMGTSLCYSDHKPRYLAFDTFHADIYVSMHGRVGKLDVNDSTRCVDTIFGEGNSIGQLTNTEIDTADDLMQLDKEMWIVADSTADR